MADRVLDISVYRDYVVSNGLLMHKLSSKRADQELKSNGQKQPSTTLAQYSAFVEVRQQAISGQDNGRVRVGSGKAAVSEEEDRRKV